MLTIFLKDRVKRCVIVEGQILYQRIIMDKTLRGLIFLGEKPYEKS